MSNYRDELIKLIKPIFDIYKVEICPATESQINDFKKIALERGVPNKTISELTEFYKVSNGIPCLDSLDIHKINDFTIFEWWDDNELWLGQRDFYTIRWKGNKYHLGDSSNVNFGDKYISDSLIGILQIGIAEWYSN